MNTTGCCNSSPSAESLFAVGNYKPASAGYPQMYSFPNAGGRAVASLGAYPSSTMPTGITPVGNSPAGAGIPSPRPYNYETATLGGYNRGGGNPDPMYSVGSYVDTGNPTRWAPMNAYAKSGNPTLWKPLGNFAGSGNGGTMVSKMGSGLEQIGTRPVGGIQPVGIFSLWPLVATIVGLGAVAGATYVADTGVDNITTDASIATAISQPIVKTTSNIATAVGLGLLGYFLFRKDIQKLIK